MEHGDLELSMLKKTYPPIFILKLSTDLKICCHIYIFYGITANKISRTEHIEHKCRALLSDDPFGLVQLFGRPFTLYGFQPGVQVAIMMTRPIETMIILIVAMVIS